MLAFAAGFIVRPFGSLVFGRLGDMSGRKHTFLITIVLMGLPTFIVGLLPSYATIGMAAPIALIALRLLQGLAVGGEYGGAVTYVAEYSTPSNRGFNTSWIQTTGTGGLLLSLFVILGVRTLTGEKQFASWGWRVPFLFSIALLGVSMWIRLKLKESPEFEKMKVQGTRSKSPLRDTFGNRRNAMTVLLSLLGCTAGLGVVAYTSQFYVQFFLLQTLKVDGRIANEVLAIALVLGLPLYVFFGWLSDRIGRKPVILTGSHHGPGYGICAAWRVLTAVQPRWNRIVHPFLRLGQSRARAQRCSIQYGRTTARHRGLHPHRRAGDFSSRRQGTVALAVRGTDSGIQCASDARAGVQRIPSDRRAG
ncbi:MFS family permease [Paraburkholderia sp. GAS38]